MVITILSINALYEWLISRFTLKQLRRTDISRSFYENMKFNMIHSAQTQKNNIKIIDADIQLFQIIKDSTNSIYFSEQLTDYTPVSFSPQRIDEDILLLIMNPKADFFWVNNSYLFSEMMVQRGFDVKDSLSKWEFESAQMYLEEKDREQNLIHRKTEEH